MLNTLQCAGSEGYPVTGYESERIANLEKKIAEVTYEQAKDRQRIATLELALDAISGGRRNYRAEASKLLRELYKRGTAMDYRDIRNFSHLSEDKEAYRLLHLTHKMYPGDTKIINAADKKRNIAIVYRGERL